LIAQLNRLPVVAFGESPALNHYNVTVRPKADADFVSSVWSSAFPAPQNINYLAVANHAGESPEANDIADSNRSNHKNLE